MRLVVAELRDSWRAWLGVSITLLVSTFCLALSMLGLVSSLEFMNRTPGWEQEQSGDTLYFAIVTGFNVAICALVGITVIGAAVGLVVQSRRGSLARLSLAGASATRMIGIVLGQLVAACLVFGTLGGGLAFAAYWPTWRWLAQDRRVATPDIAPEPAAALWGVLLCVVVALFGGLGHAIRASRIPPVEALREAAAPASRRRPWLRWAGAIVLTALAVSLWQGTAAALRAGGQELRSLALQVPIMVLPIIGVLFVQAKELFMNGLTRGWTSLVPGGSATWHLARHTALGKGERLSRSITPSMFAVGLLVGMVALGATLNASLEASAAGFQIERIGLEALMPFAALGLTMALSGAVSSLVMMSSQREGELALDGVIGATPAQQSLIPVLEGVIISVTATLLGVLMGAVAVLCLVDLMPLIFPQTRVRIPWLELGVVAVATTAVIVAATTLPVLGSLRQPPNRVLARLVAE